ncbi:MAG: hypothetical protein J0I79_33810, partial [Mesorhizobium sp.]|uniref:LysR substrate-binding domain-containing protein n=1 Tax=Mesorhizobium sp. TaxID=1871066 RepID=UPI001AC9F34D
ATPEGASALRQPSDLLQAPLIHDERPIGWADWFRHAGITANGTWTGTNFSDSDFALAAAELGQGVALGSLTLAARALSEGALTQPFDHVLETGRTWYAVSTPDRLRGADVRGTWNWLREQA